jgi:hypothetical protein
MQTEEKSRKLLRILRDDNVLIVVTPARSGDREVIDGHEVVFTQDIAIGHKVNRRAGKLPVVGVPSGWAPGHSRRAIYGSDSIHCDGVSWRSVPRDCVDPFSDGTRFKGCSLPLR